MASLRVPVNDKDHTQGPEAANVTLVEYGDYECPSCGQAYPIVKRIQQQFEDRLRFVFRNFPLSEIHPEALPAAIVAEFAGTRGKFWEAHDGLFENQNVLGTPFYSRLLLTLDLSPEEFAREVRDNSLESRVRSDFRGGVRSGVNGTPTFFINGHRHDGPFTFDALGRAIEVEIERPKNRGLRSRAARNE